MTQTSFWTLSAKLRKRVLSEMPFNPAHARRVINYLLKAGHILLSLSFSGKQATNIEYMSSILFYFAIENVPAELYPVWLRFAFLPVDITSQGPS